MTPMGTVPTLAEFLLARLPKYSAPRQIVERYVTLAAAEDPAAWRAFALAEYEFRILPLLALPYAGHPDYRREWAPGAPLSPLSPGVS